MISFYKNKFLRNARKMKKQIHQYNKLISFISKRYPTHFENVNGGVKQFLATKEVFWVNLRVPKCEIFDHSYFYNFYSIKSLCEGDFGVKIKVLYKNI